MSISDCAVAHLANHLVVLLLQPLEPEALLRLGLLAHRVEDLLEIRDVASRLVQVPLETLAEVRVLNLLDELRQDLFGELLLDEQDVAELVQEEIPRCGDVCHLTPSYRF